MTSGGLSMTEGWNLQLQARVRRLEEALRPLVAAWEAHEEKSSGPRAEGQADAYYMLAKHLRLDWERAKAALATVSEADIAAALGEEPPPKTFPVPERMLNRLGVVAERMRGRVDAIVEREGSIEKAITSHGVGIGYLLAKEIFDACRTAADVMDGPPE